MTSSILLPASPYLSNDTPAPFFLQSTRHTEVVDAITRYLGYGSYAEWGEERRVQWLAGELQVCVCVCVYVCVCVHACSGWRGSCRWGPQGAGVCAVGVGACVCVCVGG